MTIEILIDLGAWKEQARAYAQSKYALGEIVDEYSDDHFAAIVADETPEYWVERIATKYDLTPTDSGW